MAKRTGEKHYEMIKKRSAELPELAEMKLQMYLNDQGGGACSLTAGGHQGGETRFGLDDCPPPLTFIFSEHHEEEKCSFVQ